MDPPSKRNTFVTTANEYKHHEPTPKIVGNIACHSELMVIDEMMQCEVCDEQDTCSKSSRATSRNVGNGKRDENRGDVFA